MDSLTNLRRNTDLQVFRIALTGGGPADTSVRRHFVHFVRVVDLAVEEYERARGFVEIAKSPGGEERVTSALRAIDHLELSVITLARAVNALSAIAKEDAAPEVPRDIRKKIETVSKKFRAVRNTVVHVEEYLVRREFKEGESHALRIVLDGSSARIGQHEIRLSSLASLLQDLHGLATIYAEYREAGESDA